MTEHTFMAVMLGVIVFEVVAMCVVLGIITYRIYRKSESTDKLVAAVYLEARKILEQSR